MIFDTNENFGGDTVTYTIHHVTHDGRILHRESLSESPDASERKISVMGFGERFFRYQEPYAIRQLTLKLEDPDSCVRLRAAGEILACFDFQRGILRAERRDFLNSEYTMPFLKSLKTGIERYLRSNSLTTQWRRELQGLVQLLQSCLG